MADEWPANDKTFLKQDTIDALTQEVASARTKFPGSANLDRALTEEMLELFRAYNDKEGEDRVKAEALQVACVALRIYEEGPYA